MKTLKVQEFLRNQGHVDYYTPATFHLDRLKEKYAINYKAHSLFPHLYLLKYNQIESPFSEEIVRECRGLILNSLNSWEVMCCPFFKFFNIQQPEAAKIDWKTARVQEKLDGSLCNLWWYNGWNLSTSGCPDGMNQINDTDLTFGKLFWELFNKQQLNLEELNQYYTYMFELTSPFNRVVVDHKTSKVTLIGIRNNQTLEEISVDSLLAKVVVKGNEDYIVRSYPLTTIEECLDAANKLNPLEHEGFVAVDANFNRGKIKVPAYVALHHMKDSCSVAKLAEVVRQGEFEEFSIVVESYPEIKVRFFELVEKYKDIVKSCNDLFNNIKGIESQKEFALKACESPYSTVLFSMRKTGKSPQEIIKNMLENAYLRLIGVK